ncbi:PCDHD2 [Acanthosepion pharaonis]|uniref:PCDHD2 n=1 Tax=Acanthosepion pharaonis TaxID=158019 RepID=A0A812BHZ0_ACAPH|nr:PCDHD2 [Sepia pharaonis]
MLVPVCVLLSVLNRCLCADLTYYVREGKSPGTYVGDIAADTHLMESVLPQDRSRIRFTQLQPEQAGSTQLFRVSERTGKLYTGQTLDAESMCKWNKECFIMLDVAVRKGTTSLKILEIKVIVQDNNDHPPEFPDKSVNIEFSENDRKGTKKIIPNAIDRDVGVENSQITYQLKKKTNEPFTLSVSKSVDGTSKLGINLEETLDREVKDSYLVQVIAKDGGSPPKQSVLDVHIAVSDVNDNFPAFSKKVNNVSIINEPSETSPVVILSARDYDSDKNGRIRYHFGSQTSSVAKSHFKLNEVTGEIFLRKKFLLGQELTHELYVEATDGGSPPLSSIAKVQVNVINQQNHAPSIDMNFVSTSTENSVAISEDIAVGSFIAYVKVTDYDVGQNGEVTCKLHHEKFQLQNLGTKKYQVIVKSPLDREEKDHHDITISCQDKGYPPLRSESKFSIQVMDVNDVRPQFSKKTLKFFIYENENPRIPVGYINATDTDLGLGGKLTYSLLTNNKHFLPFQISDNGLISTVMSLDHEFQDIYKFKVFVKDNGIPSLNNTVDVVVEVRDKNDNAPYFTFPTVSPYSMDVVYYPNSKNNITVLKAADKDSRENAFLKFEITKGNKKRLFSINHYSGLLSFTREVTLQDAGTYDLQFVVKDSGSPVLSATTTLLLTLTVSNKTSEMVNEVQTESDKKIHLYLLIVIVSVAVTVSVVVTVSMLICLVRCNNRRNALNRGRLNRANKREQRHLKCPPYLGPSCTDATPPPRTAEPDKPRQAEPERARPAEVDKVRATESDKVALATSRRTSQYRDDLVVEPKNPAVIRKSPVVVPDSSQKKDGFGRGPGIPPDLNFTENLGVIMKERIQNVRMDLPNEQQYSRQHLIQEEGATSALKEAKKGPFVVAPDKDLTKVGHKEKLTSQSSIDSAHSKKEAEIALSEKSHDSEGSDYSLARPPEQSPNINIKTTKPRFNCPGDAKMTSKRLFQPIIAQIPQTKLKPVSIDSTSSGSHSHPSNQHDNRRRSSDLKQPLSVAHVAAPPVDSDYVEPATSESGSSDTYSQPSSISGSRRRTSDFKQTSLQRQANIPDSDYLEPVTSDSGNSETYSQPGSTSESRRPSSDPKPCSDYLEPISADSGSDTYSQPWSLPKQKKKILQKQISHSDYLEPVDQSVRLPTRTPPRVPHPDYPGLLEQSKHPVQTAAATKYHVVEPESQSHTRAPHTQNH